MSFGTYSPLNSAATSGSNTVSIRCTKGTAYTFYNTLGTAYGVYQSYSVGIMTDGNGNNLYFQQYVTSAGLWADDNHASTSYQTSSTGTGLAQNFAQNYRILPSQYVSPANYSVSETLVLAF